MARPGQLVESVATELGLSAASVALYNRTLRDGRAREAQVAGRGRGAVSVRDAATLLIAVLGSPSPAESVEVAERFGRLLFRKGDVSKKIGPARLAALSPNHTFLDGLAALIEDAMLGSLAVSVGKRLKRKATEIDHECVALRVTVTSPFASARINISPVDQQSSEPTEECTLLYGRVAYKDAKTRRTRFDPPIQAINPDLSWERSFSQKTVFAVAKVLNG